MSRHRSTDRPWLRPVLLMITAAAILVLYMSVADSLREPTKPVQSAPSTQIKQPPGRNNGRFTDSATPTTTKKAKPRETSAVAEQLFKAARKIKPLEELQEGDRVLFNDEECYWRAWASRRIDVSTIECGEGNVFDVVTARLHPVELRKNR